MKRETTCPEQRRGLVSGVAPRAPQPAGQAIVPTCADPLLHSDVPPPGVPPRFRVCAASRAVARPVVPLNARVALVATCSAAPCAGLETRLRARTGIRR